MNEKMVEEIAAAVLYEGYVLYPYRASAVKNRQRWNFGVLYPRAYTEAQLGNDRWYARTECLVEGDRAEVKIRVRFLELVPREVDDQPWQGARERSVEGVGEFVFGDLQCSVQASQEPLRRGLSRIGVEIRNTSPARPLNRDEALYRSLVSTHTILSVANGAFVSLLEPPAELSGFAAACRNEGTWPVLIGEQGARDAMLSSPIILYDYPQIAPESRGALFDGTEIDEILTLRILTLTDREKQEMGALDERTREILDRTESMTPEEFMKLHGVLRGTNA